MSSETADPLDMLERELAVLAFRLTTPLPRECVLCFTHRMLDEFGCSGQLRWAGHWRDLRAPRATALERRLGQRGGYCDCEVFENGWAPDNTAVSYDDQTDEWHWRGSRPACRGVRRGSSQACGLWKPLYRRRWYA